jgi:hypothetical protein
MTLERIALVLALFLFCLTGYFTVRSQRVTTDPASSMAGFFLFRVHCPIPEPTSVPQNDAPAATVGYLHLYQANLPF